MKTLILILLFLSANTVFAQEDEDEERDSTKYEIEELTITGTRTYKKIIDIPYSIFRVDKKELSYGKKVSAKDLLQDVPGLFLQNRYGGSDLRISLRGYGTRSNIGIRGIRILQDNIPVSEADGQTVADEIDFNSLGGVEVVKGNVSSLYANAPGGVINFISDLYFPQSFARTINMIGKFGQKQTNERVGVKTDNFRFATSYNYKNIDGFRPHSSEYSHLINSVFEGYLGSRATLTILGSFVKSFNRFPGSLTAQEYNSNDYLQAYYLAVSQDFKRFTNKGRIAARYRSYVGKGQDNEIEVTGFGSIKNIESADVDAYTIQNRYSAGSFLRFRTKTKLLKRDNDFNIGMDYAFQSGPITDYENIGGQRGLTINNEIEDNIGNLGVYFYDQINILWNKLDFYVSGRYDKFVYSRNSLNYNGLRDTIRKFEQFTPKVALNFKLTKTVALYTSYGRGYDVPSASELNNNYFTSNQGATTLNPDLKPQVSDNFEVGIKGDLKNKKKGEWLRKAFFDITFFNYKIKDDLVPFIIGSKTYYRNAARTTRTGVEVGIKTEPVERVDMIINYIYTHFKYDAYDALVYDSTQTVSHQNYSGNMLPSYPSHILNFILEYEYKIGKNINGILQFDCDYVTKMYVDDKNSVSTSPYFFSNPMAGINITLNRLNILAFAQVTNITNRKYVGFVNINDYYGRYFEPNEPRNFIGGINISYKF